MFGSDLSTIWPNIFTIWSGKAKAYNRFIYIFKEQLFLIYRAMEKSVSRQTHYLKVAGAEPARATIRANEMDKLMCGWVTLNLFIEVGGVVGIRSITIQLLNSMGLYDLSIMNTRTKRRTIILNFCFYKFRSYGIAAHPFEEKLNESPQYTASLQ